MTFIFVFHISSVLVRLVESNLFSSIPDINKFASSSHQPQIYEYWSLSLESYQLIRGSIKRIKLQLTMYKCSITSSFLNQIMSHKAQNSSFFILFHLHQLKLPKTPPNGITIEEVKGACDFTRSHWNSKPRNTQSADISNSSLHIISYVVFLGRTTYPVQFSFLFLFHYRP